MTSATTYDYRPGFIARQINMICLTAEKKALSLSTPSMQRAWLRRQLHKSVERPDLLQVSALLAESVLKNHLTGMVAPSVLRGQLGKHAVYRGRWELPSKYFVFPGDWDITPLVLEENLTYQTMKSLLAHLDDVKKSKAYVETCEAVSARGELKFNGRVLSSVGDVDDYFRNYADLAQSIKRDGFCSQHENLTGVIGVALGRDGEFIHFRRGHHRIALARELGVARIKVRILSIHPGFMLKYLNAEGDILEHLQTTVSNLFEREKE